MAWPRDPDGSLLRLFHLLLVLFIIVLLMWGGANQFLARRQDAMVVNWQQRVADFAERVELLHGVWLAQGHPRQLYHRMAGESGYFVMNAAGWPIDWQPSVSAPDVARLSSCSRLWRGILGAVGQQESLTMQFDLDLHGGCSLRSKGLVYRYDVLQGNVIPSEKGLGK